MKDVGANFFDDFYLQVCTACEDKLLELEWKLKVEKRRAIRMFCALTGKEPMIKLKNLKLLSIQKYNVNIL